MESFGHPNSVGNFCKVWPTAVDAYGQSSERQVLYAPVGLYIYYTTYVRVSVYAQARACACVVVV